MILAVDTSTSRTTIALIDTDGRVIVEREHDDARGHAEAIGPMLAEVVHLLDGRGVRALACGVGPGPYTGLRVGIAAALALGAAWEVPVHGLCSLDAVAAEALASFGGTGVADGMPGQSITVAVDARRSEAYWARYDASGVRVDGPRVGPLTSLPADAIRSRPRAAWVGRCVQSLVAEGAVARTGTLPLDVHGQDTGATATALAGAALLPPRPLYLRRPDAIERSAQA